MSKTTKRILIVISLFVILACGSGFLFYNFIAKKVTSKELVQVLIEKNIREIYPDAQINFGNVNISLSTSLKINIDQFSVKNKGAQQILKVQNCAFKIPLLNFIFSGRKIVMNFNSTEVFYPAYFNTVKNKKVEFKLPNYLLHSQIDVKADGLKAIITKENDSKEIVFNKFLLRDVRIKEGMAFEFQTNAKLNLKHDVLNAEVLVIGQLNTDSLFTEDLVKGLAVIKISKISVNERLIEKEIKVDSSFSHNFSNGYSKVDNVATTDGNAKLDFQYESQGNTTLIQFNEGHIPVSDLFEWINVSHPYDSKDGKGIVLTGFIKQDGKNLENNISLSLDRPLKDGDIEIEKCLLQETNGKVQFQFIAKRDEGTVELVSLAKGSILNFALEKKSIEIRNISAKFKKMQFKKPLEVVWSEAFTSLIYSGFFAKMFTLDQRKVETFVASIDKSTFGGVSIDMDARGNNKQGTLSLKYENGVVDGRYSVLKDSSSIKLKLKNLTTIGSGLWGSMGIPGRNENCHGNLDLFWTELSLIDMTPQKVEISLNCKRYQNIEEMLEKVSKTELVKFIELDDMQDFTFPVSLDFKIKKEKDLITLNKFNLKDGDNRKVLDMSGIIDDNNPLKSKLKIKIHNKLNSASVLKSSDAHKFYKEQEI